MDTQSVTPVVGQPSGPAIQGNATQANVGTRPAGGDAPVESGKSASAPDTPVRTRDPRSLQFQVDSATKQVVTQIVDEDNKVVVVQIPDAEVLRIAQAIDRMKGFLLEGKA
jgi:flagellar protein FlaG